MEGLDMTLDDMIQKSRNLKRKMHFSESSDGITRGSGRDRGYAPVPTRRSVDRGSGRGRGYASGLTRRSVDLSSSSRTMPSSTRVNQLPGMQGSNLTVGGRNAETILRVSGLSSLTSHDDIRILFSDVGKLNWYSIHYDEQGVFKGDADVAYQRHSDAVAAINRYNNMRLDGKRMAVILKVPVIGYHSPWAPNNPAAGLEMPAGSSRRRDGTELENQHGKIIRGSKRGKSSSLSVEQLNAELDQYHEEGMHRM